MAYKMPQVYEISLKMQQKYPYQRLPGYTGITLSCCSKLNLFLLPAEGAQNTVGIRVGSCFAYGIAVYALLFLDRTEALSVGLGLVLMAMVGLFLAVVVELGIDWGRFGMGLIPNIPQVEKIKNSK